MRLLSHCYGYLRFFYESTFVLADSDQRNGIRDAVWDTGITAPGQDSIKFCLGKPQQTDLRAQLARPKTSEEGENDLHLETPGLWSKTLYSDTYDIPELFLVLLSQVIRLANEQASKGHLTWSELSTRAQDLETCILEWKPRQVDGTQESADVDACLVRHMHDALQKALTIYFYRRIYNVDPSILQHQVRHVRDAVFRCETVAGLPIGFTGAFVWPGFIAACEALDSDLQGDFSAWFEARASTSGLQVLSFIVQVIQQVWDRRRDSGDRRYGWPQVLKEENLRIFYC